MHETWGKNGAARRSAVGGNVEFLGEQRRRPRELKYTAGKETRGAKRAEKKMAQETREAAGGVKTCRWRDG